MQEEVKRRLLEEREQLSYRVQKLGDFISAPAYSSVSTTQQVLLQLQLHYMKAYLSVLDNRVLLNLSPEEISNF